MANEVRGAMFDEFVQGGLIDDADVLIREARFTQWDYQGKVQSPVLALCLKMEDSDGTVHEQYLSSGELRFFTPSEDGRKAVPVASQQKLNINTNAVAFLISLMNADTRGELAAKLRSVDDIGVLDGARIHIIRKAQPKRAGIIQQAGADGQQREKTQLICERILSYPWEAAPATAPAGQARAAAPAAGVAAAPAVAAAAAAPAGGAAGVDDQALGILMQILAEGGGSMNKSALGGKVFNHPDLKAAPPATRNAVLGRVMQPAFLAGLAGMGVQFDPATGNVTLG